MNKKCTLILAILSFSLAYTTHAETNGNIVLKKKEISVDLNECLDNYQSVDGDGQCTVVIDSTVKKQTLDLMTMKVNCTKVAKRDLKEFNEAGYDTEGEFSICATPREYTIYVQTGWKNTNVSLSEKFKTVLKSAVREALAGKSSFSIYYYDVQ